MKIQKIKNYIYNLNNIKNLANIIAKYVKSNKCHLLLYGDMGTGKTTLIKYIIKNIYKNENEKINVTSPTYAYLNQYNYNNFIINHFDLYRLNNLKEFEELGFTEYLNQENSICIIEWPEIIENIIDNFKFIKLYLQYNNLENRTISLHFN